MNPYAKILSALLISLTTMTGLSQITKQQAISFVMDSIVGNKADSMNVFMEADSLDRAYYVTSPYDSILSPYQRYWLFFIDQAPDYYWTHPCEYVQIDYSTGEHNIIPHRMPPIRYTAVLEPISVPILYNAECPDFNIEYNPPQMMPENSNLHAVMFTGGDIQGSCAFWNALSHMYCGLREHGFPKENIFVLSASGVQDASYNPSLDLDNDGSPIPDIIEQECNVTNIQQIFSNLNLGPADLLYVFVTTHGGLDIFGNPNEDALWYLYNNQELKDSEFAEMIRPLNCAQMIFCFWSCFSGGFTGDLLDLEYFGDPLNLTKKTILTATNCELLARNLPPFYDIALMDQFNYLLGTAIRGWHPDKENRAPWNVTHPLGSDPDFNDMFPANPVEFNFDLPENDGNGDGIQEFQEIMNYIAEYDAQFHDFGSKVYTNGFHQDVPEHPTPDLQSIFGITGKVGHSQTVTGDFLIGGPLSVESGVELTLDDETTFYVFNSAVIVKPSIQSQSLNGGILTIDGGKLTSANNTSTWKGVEVWGHSDQSQTPETNQGSLFINRGGTIENAQIGVMASKRNGQDPRIPQQGYSGGIVMADDAHFINNTVGVYFDSYSYYDHSTFNKTSFVTNTDMIEGEVPDYFAKIYDVNGIRFKGCTFENTAPVPQEQQPYLRRGTGIFGFNAGFRVDETCLSGDIPCSQPQPSRFEGLYRGIYAMNGCGTYSPFVLNSVFQDNLKNVYLSGFNGISHATVLGNTFRVIHPSEYPIDSVYGLYLNNCSGYHVEGNRFYSETVYADGIGLVINNSGTPSNEVYRNTFYNLCYATVSQNENRNYNPPLHLGGLCYKCNQFVREDLEKPNSYDFSITYNMQYGNTTGIAKNQGTYISGTTFSPAGNMFKPSPPTGHYDFYNSGNAIDYYYHNSSSLPFRLKPLPQYIYGTVTSTPVEADFTESSCPSTIGNITPEILVEQLITATDSSNSLGIFLTTLVDGGATESLNYDVESSTPPQALQIRNELLTKSPYLSDTVMKTSVVKDEVLDNAMIRDVLVANPHSAKSDEIVGMLEERAVPMPDYMIEQILAGEDTVSAKEVIEANKAYWDGVCAKSYHKLIRYYKSDSSSIANDDSLVWLMNYRNTAEAYYDKATWYHSKGEYSQAYNVLNSIPSVFSLTPSQIETHQNFIDFLALSEQIKADTVHPFGLDSITQASLQTIAEDNLGIPGTYARNWLIAAGKINYQEPVILPDTGLKSSKKKKFKGVKETEDGSILSVFPNPAYDHCVVKINTGDLTGSGILNLYNENGLILQSYAVMRTQDQISIPTAHLKSGIYLIVLDLESKQRDKVKITVIN